MPGAPTLPEIERTLEEILKPLRDQLDAIDGEIAVLDERKAELKEVRARVARLLGANAPRQKPGPKQQKTGKGTGKPSDEKLDELTRYLRKHLDGQEFTNPGLGERKDWLGFSDAYTSHLLNAMHERGILQLVRTGHPEYGNRTKIWRLTNAKA